MAWNYSNNSVQTILSAGIDGVVGSISVGSITGFPVVYPYTLILDYGAANREVVTVTAGTGTTLTVTRGQDGTAAVAHSANAVVVHGVVARDLAEPQAHIPVAQAHIAAGTNVHGLAGGAAVVGTTTAQTLTNKTLDNTSAITVKDNVFTLQDDVDPTKQAVFQLASITTGTTRTYTFPNTAGALVTATGAQTLDSKTLTNVPSMTLAGFDVGGVWLPYTPVWTASVTNPVLGNGTIGGRYQRLGAKTVTVNGQLQMGTTTTYGSGNYAISVPVAAIGGSFATGSLWIDSGSGTSKIGICIISGTTLTLTGSGGIITPTTPQTFANADIIRWTITYEAA